MPGPPPRRSLPSGSAIDQCRPKPFAIPGRLAAAFALDAGNTVPAQLTGIRHLDIAAPGNDLAAAPLAAFRGPVPVAQSAMITPGGGTVIASSCRAAQHTATAQVVELAATDGQLIRVLRTQTARFGTDGVFTSLPATTPRTLPVSAAW